MASMVECRNCGAGAPLDAHFCPQCEHILPLPRNVDYYTFVGLPRRLTLDRSELDQRFRHLSRQFHPDFFYNAPPAERLASLERSSYLNDAYRLLREPVARVEYLLGLEGLSPVKVEAGRADIGEMSGSVTVPPALLEEVFALNEELDEIREAREAGADGARLAERLEAARAPIERKRELHEQQLEHLSAEWDERHDRATLDALRERLLERGYLRNLLATIDREKNGLGLTA